MSLDVYLKSKAPIRKECYHCGSFYDEYEELYWANITHNLATMADRVGIHDALWNPEEIGITDAKDLIPILEKGLKKLKSAPDFYKQYNAGNGWGTVDDFIPWIERYIEACKNYPDSVISVSR